MFLGLDLGTSGLKGVLIDIDGKVLATESDSLQVTSPYPLWSEQDPLSWWQALKSVVAKLHVNMAKQGLNLGSLQGIGLSGQMHGATFLDRQGKVLRPCILWNDGRSFKQCEQLMQVYPELLQRSGNLAMPGFTAPKVLWLKEYEPDTYKKVQYVLLPKDYLSYRLTDHFSTDCSDAAGTLWLNPETRQWDDELLKVCGLSQQNMPKVYEACDVVATLSKAVALALDLPQVPVVAGAGDNAAGAVGMGIINPEQGLLSLGTSGVYFSVSDKHKANPENTVHAFCHALPKRWHQMGVTLSGANSLAWLAGILNQPVADLLTRLSLWQAKQTTSFKTQVIFLPYLNGERTPYNDPQMRGQFIGLVNDTSPEEMTLAVLEGVAFSLLDCQNALKSAGSDAKDLSLIGGGARSPIWRQILANVLNKRLIYRDGGEVGPGLGAARLALIGVQGLSQLGGLDEIIQHACHMPSILDSHEPDQDMRAYYLAKYALYQAYAKASLILNHELAKLT